MPTGLRITEQAFGRTRNRAVLPVLAAAMRSDLADIRAAAIRSTLRRHDIDSHTQLIRHFHELAPEDKAVLRETHRTMRHHAASALKAAILNGDATLCRNACDLVLLCSDHEMFPTLVQAAEKPGHVQRTRIAATVLKFAMQLHEDVAAWAKSDRSGQDPSFARHHVLAAIERSLKRPVNGQLPEVVNALLLLAPGDHAALLGILHDTRNAHHSQLITSLSTNKSPVVMERLVAMLRDIDTPAAALEVIGRRSDPAFVDFLLHSLKHPVSLRVLHNMKRLRHLAWVQDDSDMVLDFDGAAQGMAVSLAAASTIDRDALFRFLRLMLRHGLGEARRLSCAALAAFERPEADELVIAALDDPDAGVQAAAVRQLRSRRIPTGLQMLVAQLKSPMVEVREAARSSLAEFNFLRYRAMFDLLDEQAVRTTGALVRQVDHLVPDKLTEELTSPSVTTKLRGIEMAVAMGAVDDVRNSILSLARHENAAVRKEAVAALAFASGPDVIETLDFAVGDANRSVADAARQSLAKQKFNDTSWNAAAIQAGSV